MGLGLTLQDAFHTADGGHRWVAPEGVDQAAWEAEVRGHINKAKGSCAPRRALCAVPGQRQDADSAGIQATPLDRDGVIRYG